MRISVRMLRLAGFIAAFAMGTSVPARGATIFSETFDGLTRGTPIDAAPYSERASGTYFLINSLPGWSASSLSEGVYAFEYGSANYAILLNESGSQNHHSISRDISGLTVGLAYDLQFQYWGDNVPAAYSFNVTINGATTSYSATGVTAPTGGFVTVDIPFVAGGTSTTLTFLETNPLTASPVFDNILITSGAAPDTAPEPATALLAGCAIGLLALARRRATR